MSWRHRHLLGIAQLSREDVVQLLDAAERWFDMPREEVKTARVLQGRTVINLFYESSTRTRTSFEVAGKRLGADLVNVSPQTSSVTKGETLLDTVKNLEALRADAIVLRHPASGAPDFVSAHTSTSIVNAGDGAHEHPTQALLDAFSDSPRSRGVWTASSWRSAVTSSTRAWPGPTPFCWGSWEPRSACAARGP